MSGIEYSLTLCVAHHNLDMLSNCPFTSAQSLMCTYHQGNIHRDGTSPSLTERSHHDFNSLCLLLTRTLVATKPGVLHLCRSSP